MLKNVLLMFSWLSWYQPSIVLEVLSQKATVVTFPEWVTDTHPVAAAPTPQSAATRSILRSFDITLPR